MITVMSKCTARRVISRRSARRRPQNCRRFLTSLRTARRRRLCICRSKAAWWKSPRAARGIAFFNFEELCSKPLGAADYLAIAECFSAVLIDQVPQLAAERRNEAARFITLIDALYEAKVKLFMAAAAAARTTLSRRRSGFRLSAHCQPSGRDAMRGIPAEAAFEQLCHQAVHHHAVKHQS